MGSYSFSGDSVSQAAAAKVMAEELRMQGQQALANSQAQQAKYAADSAENRTTLSQPLQFGQLLADLYRTYSAKPRPQSPSALGGLVANGAYAGGAQAGMSRLSIAPERPKPDIVIDYAPEHWNLPAQAPATGFDGDPSQMMLEFWKKTMGRQPQFQTPADKQREQWEAADEAASRYEQQYATGNDPTTRLYAHQKMANEAYDKANAQYKQDWLAKNPLPDPSTPEGKQRILSYMKGQRAAGIPLTYQMALRDLSYVPELPKPQGYSPKPLDRL